tara:strand:- start:445 stop:696 length:252 start_codon:yes stop_codon:yes gene_type:complete
MREIIGYLFIIVGVADFLLGNFAQINLTYFLGPLSTFSPYVFGGIGFVILNFTGGSNSGYDPELDERFKDAPTQKRNKKKKRK